MPELTGALITKIARSELSATFTVAFLTISSISFGDTAAGRHLRLSKITGAFTDLHHGLSNRSYLKYHDLRNARVGRDEIQDRSRTTGKYFSRATDVSAHTVDTTARFAVAAVRRRSLHDVAQASLSVRRVASTRHRFPTWSQRCLRCPRTPTPTTVGEQRGFASDPAGYTDPG